MDTEEFLAHYGVKGMKWGVRKDAGHEGERATTKAIAKADKKYDRSFSGSAGFVKVHNAMADNINSRLGGLNDRYDGHDLTKPGRVQEKYLKEYERIVEKSARIATERFGTNASGTRQLKVSREGSGLDSVWKAEMVDLKHADAQPYFKITPKFNEKGFIVSQKIELVGSAVKHEEVDAFLAHYGVKGMKWGQRKAGSEIRAARKATRTQFKEVKKQGKVLQRSAGTKSYGAEKKKFETLNTAFLKNPDRATANTMTKGEMALVALGFAAVGGVGGAAIGVGAIAGQSAYAARIRGKQAEGAYDKDKK